MFPITINNITFHNGIMYINTRTDNVGHPIYPEKCTPHAYWGSIYKMVDSWDESIPEITDVFEILTYPTSTKIGMCISFFRSGTGKWNNLTLELVYSDYEDFRRNLRKCGQFWSQVREDEHEQMKMKTLDAIEKIETHFSMYR